MSSSPEIRSTRSQFEAHCGEGCPRIGNVLVELRSSPVGAALVDAVRGEEEDGARTVELAAPLRHLGPVGHPDRRAVGEVIAVVGVHVGTHGAVAGDVDVDGTVARQLGDVVVEVNRVVDV